MLRAQLHKQKPQEVPNLGGGANGGFAATARQALLDGDCWGDAVDRVDLGAACRLHDAAGVGVQRFQIAPLTLVEEDVKGKRGFAGARYAGHHVELAAWDVDA